MPKNTIYFSLIYGLLYIAFGNFLLIRLECHILIEITNHPSAFLNAIFSSVSYKFTQITKFSVVTEKYVYFTK